MLKKRIWKKHISHLATLLHGTAYIGQFMGGAKSAMISRDKEILAFVRRDGTIVSSHTGKQTTLPRRY